MEEEMHVLTLKPQQQAALDLILYEYYLKYINKSLNDLYNINSIDKFNIKKKLIIKTFEMYYNITDPLCRRSQTSRSKSKLITLTKLAMRIIILAIESFSINNSFLTQNDKKYVLSEIKELKKLFNESSKYTYTKDEIKKMGGIL